MPIYNFLTASHTQSMVVGLLALTISSPSGAQSSALDGGDHSGEIDFKPAFQFKLVPLDASLPWRERFKDNDEFDEAYSLSKPLMSNGVMEKRDLLEPTAKGNNTGGSDVKGIINKVKLNEGKLKVTHGPIDKFGMPAMTMIFKVNDPVLLEGLQPGMEIGFDVESTASGFVITNISQ